MDWLIAFIILALFTLLLGAVAKRRVQTGSLSGSPQPGMGSGRTTREKHPFLFWFWNVQLIGATLMVSVVAAIIFLNGIGLIDFSNTAESKNAPNR